MESDVDDTHYQINEMEKEVVKIEKNVVELEKDENKMGDEKVNINWLEMIYSTVVESFSVMDLYTDIIVFSELLSDCVSMK